MTIVNCIQKWDRMRNSQGGIHLTQYEDRQRFIITC